MKLYRATINDGTPERRWFVLLAAARTWVREGAEEYSEPPAAYVDEVEFKVARETIAAALNRDKFSGSARRVWDWRPPAEAAVEEIEL